MESLSLSRSVINNLNSSMSRSTKMQRHLQTGRKITQPSDNVGEVGKISKLKYNIKANFARRQNLQNALSFAQAQDGAMKNMGNIIKRAGEINALYDSPLADAKTKANYDEEFIEIQKQIRDISSAKWNGVSLFTPSEYKLNIGTAQHPDALVGNGRDGGDPLSIQRAGLFGHLKTTASAPVANIALNPPQGSKAEYRETIPLANNSGEITLTSFPMTVPDLYTIYHGTQKLFEVAYGKQSSYPNLVTGFDLDYSVNPIGIGTPNASNRTIAVTDNQPGGAGGGQTKYLSSNPLSPNFMVRSSDPGNIDKIEFGRGINSGNLSRELTLVVNEGNLNSGTLFDVDLGIEYDPIEPDLNDPFNVWSLADFNAEDFTRFETVLAGARAQNGAEQQRLQSELSELSAKHIDLEKAVEAVDGLDYARAMGQFNKTNDRVHMNANLVAAAKNMETVLYTDFL